LTVLKGYFFDKNPLVWDYKPGENLVIYCDDVICDNGHPVPVI
jgi:hypothetical protein